MAAHAPDEVPRCTTVHHEAAAHDHESALFKQLRLARVMPWRAFMRKHMLRVGFILLNLAAMSGCATDSPSSEVTGETPSVDQGYVKLAPEALAQLRVDRGDGTLVAPDLPEGAEVWTRAPALETEVAAGTQAFKGSSCAVTDVWHNYPIAEPIHICVGNPMVCTPAFLTVSEEVTCAGHLAGCPAPTICTASGSPGIFAPHSTPRPSRAPDFHCQIKCVNPDLCVATKTGAGVCEAD